MAVEKMQFAMPMTAGYEGFPFIPSFQAEKRKAEEAFTVRARAEPEEEAFFMVRAEPEAAILKAKSKADKEKVSLKAKAKAEAEAAKEEGIIKANCCGSDEDDVPYDKVYHDSDAEEDNETIMARIVARWDIFMKEEEARFPDQKYRVYLPGERTGDESSDSDDEHEYYLRKFGMK